MRKKTSTQGKAATIMKHPISESKSRKEKLPWNRLLRAALTQGYVIKNTMNMRFQMCVKSESKVMPQQGQKL